MEVFLIAALCGLGVGLLSGLLGIGGGTIMVPIFRLGFGMSALQATGTSLFTMVFTSIAGSVTHVRNHTCIVPLGLLAGVGGALTSPLGVYLANHSPAWLVMLATAAVIAYSATTMLRKGLALPKDGTKLQSKSQSEAGAARGSEAEPEAGAGARPYQQSELPGGSTAEYPAESTHLSKRQYVIGLMAGLAAGLAGGYVGLGGGFLMVPIFLTGVGISMKQASGTSLLAIIILAASGSAVQASYGNLEMFAGLAMALGSIPGAVLGANLVKRMPERSLRLAFGGFLLIVAAVLAINEFLV